MKDNEVSEFKRVIVDKETVCKVITVLAEALSAEKVDASTAYVALTLLAEKLQTEFGLEMKHVPEGELQ